jgi:LCP family protein required for cell wall assembly
LTKAGQCITLFGLKGINSMEEDQTTIETSNRDTLGSNGQAKQDEQVLPAQTITNEDTSSTVDSQAIKKKKRFSIGKFVSLVLILTSVMFMGFAGFAAYQILAVGDTALAQDSKDQSFLERLTDFGSALNPTAKSTLKGQDEGRTNFLFLGQDKAAGLTDTIMIVSYYHKTNEIVTLNIPRDFYFDDGYGARKINEIYPQAEARSAKSNITGGSFLSKELSDEFGIDIHYWVVVDFDGLKDIVNALDGVTVRVDNSFTDFQYPNASYGYIRPAPTFKEGSEQMNGDRALIYARSRKGDNGEGSDFARARRQSIVVQAILEKAKSQKIVSNVSKFDSYMKTVSKNFKTNMTASELSSMGQTIQNVDLENNFYRSVWATGNGILCNGSTAESYLINYCGGSIAGQKANSVGRTKGKEFVKDLLSNAKLGDLFSTEIAIYGNGSNDTSVVYQELLDRGFTNVKLNNSYAKIKAAGAKTTEKTTVYITDGGVKKLFDQLDPKLDFEYEVKTAIPETVVRPVGANAPMVVWVETVQ